MHNLASNNKHSHGVEVKLLYYSALQAVTAVSSEPKASWVVVMYTMNTMIIPFQRDAIL